MVPTMAGFQKRISLWVRGCRLVSIAAERRVGFYFRQTATKQDIYTELGRNFNLLAEIPRLKTGDEKSRGVISASERKPRTSGQGGFTESGEVCLGLSALGRLIENPQAYLGQERAQRWFGERRTLQYESAVETRQVRVSLVDVHLIALAMQEELELKEGAFTFEGAASELGIPKTTLTYWKRMGRVQTIAAVLTTAGTRKKPDLIPAAEVERLKTVETIEYESGMRKYILEDSSEEAQDGKRYVRKKTEEVRRRYVVEVRGREVDAVSLAVQEVGVDVERSLAGDYFPLVRLRKKWYSLAEIEDPVLMQGRQLSRTAVMHHIERGIISGEQYKRSRKGSQMYAIRSDAVDRLVNRVNINQIIAAVGGTFAYVLEEVQALSPGCVEEILGAKTVHVAVANDFIREKRLNISVGPALSIMQEEREFTVDGAMVSTHLFRQICANTLVFFVNDPRMREFFGVDESRPSLLVSEPRKDAEGKVIEEWRSVVHKRDSISLADLNRIGQFVTLQQRVVRNGRRQDVVHKGKYLSAVRLREFRTAGLVDWHIVYILGAGNQQVFFTRGQEEIVEVVADIRNGKRAVLSDEDALGMLRSLQSRVDEAGVGRAKLFELLYRDMGSAHRQAIASALAADEFYLEDELAREALTVISCIPSKQALCSEDTGEEEELVCSSSIKMFEERLRIEPEAIGQMQQFLDIYFASGRCEVSLVADVEDGRSLLLL